jgi:hypothetical protein
MHLRFARTGAACLAAALCFSSLPAVAQELAGRYRVKGSDPGGGSPYTGTVTIQKTGDVTYQVTWQIGDTRYVGTGIGSPEGLAVGYKAGADSGIAIYSQEGGAMKGYWTYAGGKTVGEETWSR